jgi:acyl carrier protein
MLTRQRLKELLIAELMLDLKATDIGDETPLFGPSGVGLDSVDALQLVVMLEKHYGFKMADQEQAKQVLQSVDSIAQAVEGAKAAA